MPSRNEGPSGHVPLRNITGEVRSMQDGQQPGAPASLAVVPPTAAAAGLCGRCSYRGCCVQWRLRLRPCASSMSGFKSSCKTWRWVPAPDACRPTSGARNLFGAVAGGCAAAGLWLAPGTPPGLNHASVQDLHMAGQGAQASGGPVATAAPPLLLLCRPRRSC